MVKIVSLRFINHPLDKPDILPSHRRRRMKHLQDEIRSLRKAGENGLQIEKNQSINYLDDADYIHSEDIRNLNKKDRRLKVVLEGSRTKQPVRLLEGHNSDLSSGVGKVYPHQILLNRVRSRAGIG
jgi:hypothetical protein